MRRQRKPGLFDSFGGRGPAVKQCVTTDETDETDDGIEGRAVSRCGCN